MKDTNILACWDAKRLLQEFFKMSDLIHSYQRKPFDDMAWSNQIRVRRIASALSAFMGLKKSEEKPIDPKETDHELDEWDCENM